MNTFLMKLIGCVLALFIMENTFGQSYTNPVLRGFNPDPSICRVDSNYYMVTSSFEYFPGIPIYHSTDLVNWNLQGYVVTRSSQVNMSGYPASGGLWAPTIRYHKGTFYVTASLVYLGEDKIQNILWTSDREMNSWSDSHILTHNSIEWDIDPSLFFDNDGKCYFTANRKPAVLAHPNHREIGLQELDLKTLQLKGDIISIYNTGKGAGNFTEAPHIYRKDNKYYLIVAEGGTEINHAVLMGQSNSVKGPYIPVGHNPLLTHRHLQKTVLWRNMGHGDLIDSPDGTWWMVCLGVRYNKNDWAPLGRETFLVPVEWSPGNLPVVNPGYGLVQTKYKLPAGVKEHKVSNIFTDDFDEEKLDLSWNYLRSDGSANIALNNGNLEIKSLSSDISQLTTPALVARRITDFNFELIVKAKFKPISESDEAGVALMADNSNFLLFTRSLNGFEIQKVEKGKRKQISSILSEDYTTFF